MSQRDATITKCDNCGVEVESDLPTGWSYDEKTGTDICDSCAFAAPAGSDAAAPGCAPRPGARSPAHPLAVRCHRGASSAPDARPAVP